MNRNAVALAAVLLAALCAGLFVFVSVRTAPDAVAPQAGAIDAQAAVRRVQDLRESEYYSFIVNTVLSAKGKVLARTEDIPGRIGPPDTDEHHWFVAVGEEMGGYFDAWKHFAVGSDTGAIYVYDSPTGAWVAIGDWRRRRRAAAR